jgi:zinc transport system substrate-binding protein
MSRPDAGWSGWSIALGLAAAVILTNVALMTDWTPRAEAVHGGPSAAMEIFAGIPPLGYLVQRIGGSRVHVDVLLQPGQDPHTFEPTPRQVMRLGRARLLFMVGMPFESRLVEHMAAHRAGLSIVDATQGIVKRPMTAHCCDVAEHGEDHDEEAGQPDPHVWLSPPLLKIMAANVAHALAEADPLHAADYRRNEAAMAAELDDIHARITRRLAPFRGQRFYVFHPAFGYFGDAYGLVQEPVETEGKSPTPRQLQALVRQARADGVRIIFLQPQFDPHSAEAVARAIGGSVLPLDDLAADVPGNLSDVAEQIAAALEEGGSHANIE